MNRKYGLSSLFTYPIKAIMENPIIDINYLQEIRLRADKPLTVIYKGKESFVRFDGSFCNELEDCMTCDENLIKDMIQIFSSHSLYAYEEEIRQGFLTIEGGHRVGICGKVILDGEKVKTINYISSINIRIAHQIKGCANNAMKYIYKNDSICNTLIVSPPGAGKTTLLRDIIRQISNGTEVYHGVNVGVVDERSEIAACYRGIPQNDVGIRTDVLDCCPKNQGMLMLLRSMCPKVMAVDEIGNEKDYDALMAALHCGCKLIATVHGSSYEELLKKPRLKEFINNGFFQRFIVLKSKEIYEIMDNNGNVFYSRNEKWC